MSTVKVQGNASGTGSITLAAPNTNSNQTLNLPDATGTVLTTATTGVPVGGPAFSAYANTLQNISATTFTKVTFGLEFFDTNNNFASSRFTPTVPGYYQLNTSIYTANQSFFLVRLYKNGTEFLELFRLPTGQASSAGTVVYANGATDYFEVYVYLGSAGTIGPDSGNSSIFTQFSGCMVRSAV